MPNKTFPDWWHRLDANTRTREKLLSQFTITRDGYARWYAGECRFVCGKTTPPDQVEDRWHEKRRQIDTAAARPVRTRIADEMNYRSALIGFLAVQKSRVNAPKHSIRQRTYHNYVTELNKFGNFVHAGVKIADTPLTDIGPEHFSAYAQTLATWSPSAFDSTVCRVGALFRWAVEMEYLVRYRHGPAFRRPAKQELRDSRIGKTLSFTAAEVAASFVAASALQRCWIALGMCAAFINSDVVNVTIAELGIDTGVIDFRRRKTGKVRRVIPLPADVLVMLKAYQRPQPADPAWSDLFFLTERGRPYSVTKNSAGKPSCAVSTSIGKLLRECGVKTDADGRNFKSFRTTFFNLAPRGEWDLERKIIMGRAQGTIDLDSYLEDVGVDRLKYVVDCVWAQVKCEVGKINSDHRATGK